MFKCKLHLVNDNFEVKVLNGVIANKAQAWNLLRNLRDNNEAEEIIGSRFEMFDRAGNHFINIIFTLNKKGKIIFRDYDKYIGL